MKIVLSKIPKILAFLIEYSPSGRNGGSPEPFFREKNTRQSLKFIDKSLKTAPTTIKNSLLFFSI